MTTAIRVLELLRGQQFGATLAMLWHVVEGDRESFAKQVKAARDDLPVVPIVVRSNIDNPNSFMADLVTLLENNRSSFEGIQVPDTGTLLVLFLSHTRLSVAQMSSPATLPGWFPVSPGEHVGVVVRDLASSILVHLNAPEAHGPGLCEALYDLEGLALRRLEGVWRQDHRRVSAFFDKTRGEQQESIEKVIEEAKTFLESVKLPSAYRPSLKAGTSLVSRFLRVAMKSSPTELSKVGAACVDAFGLVVDGTTTGPLVATLLRPPQESREGRLGRGLILAVFSASQLVTAAAHADDYSAVPVSLLAAMSQDILASLHGYSALLRNTGLAT